MKGPMLKLKLQYFGHLMKRDGSLKKALTLGKIAGERRDRQRMISLGIITDSMAMNLSKLQETVKDKGAWWATAQEGLKESEMTERISTEM